MQVRHSGPQFVSKNGLSLLDGFWEPHGSWAKLIPVVTHIICLQCVKRSLGCTRTRTDGGSRSKKMTPRRQLVCKAPNVTLDKPGLTPAYTLLRVHTRVGTI